MDRPETNKKKAKNWLYRLLKGKNRLQEGSDKDSEVVYRRETLDASETKLHRHSFRRSLRRMQTRVKSCMFPQETTPKRPLPVAEMPCTSAVSHTRSAVSQTRSAIPQTRPSVPQTPPPVPERPPQFFQHSPRCNSTPNEAKQPNHRIPTDEIVSLSNCFWYWGPMATADAEDKLQFKPDGTFLVRDSSSTSYLFSISFRSVGKTMHARIEYSRGRYNLCGTHAEGFSTVTELIHDAMKTSANGIYCYSRRGDYSCEFPVRLTKPISRYTEVRSLKHLCKFVIRQYTNMNDIPKLPLPTVLHGYLLEKPYF